MTDEISQAAGYDVSRETYDRLAAFERLLRKWNRTINLVARSTLDDLWSRHFMDSLQVVAEAPDNTTRWADLGSGGGFPGLVAAIAGADRGAGMVVTLVESDQRKAAFLRAAARELGLSVHVVTERIEALAPLNAEVLSARALAPLDTLLAYADRHLAPAGIALFPKGAAVQKEIDTALEHWRFTHQKIPSKTGSGGSILKIGGITRV